MIRYCFNPFGKDFSLDNSNKLSENKAKICEFLTLAFALGENMDIVPITFPVVVNETFNPLPTYLVTVDLDYRLETNDFLYIISEDSSVTRNVESLDKPYATTGRLYGLLTTKVNSIDFKKDSDDFLRLNFSYFNYESDGETSELIETKFIFITSNVNSTLTESYKPLSTYLEDGFSSVKFYDIEDLAVDAANSTVDNALTKNIMKKPMLVAKMIEPNRQLGVQQFLNQNKLTATAPITLKRF